MTLVGTESAFLLVLIGSVDVGLLNPPACTLRPHILTRPSDLDHRVLGCPHGIVARP